MESYETLRRVGRGHHATVWLVRDLRDRRLYCLKSIDLGAYNEAERAQAVGEVSLLRSLDHPCIVRYREHFLDSAGSLCLVMTFCEGGDLASAIRAQRASGAHFPEAQVLNWFAQLALALGHTHERRILHRDLKTQNVFLTKGHLIKLGDYGIARLLDGSHEQAQTVVGTPFYMSPEVCQNRPYSYASDVWALGCVLYELLALRQAWDGSNLLGLVYKIVQQTYEPPPAHYSPELRGLLAAMLAKEPGSRPSVAEILQVGLVRRAVQAIADREPDAARHGGGAGGGGGGDEPAAAHSPPAAATSAAAGPACAPPAALPPSPAPAAPAAPLATTPPMRSRPLSAAALGSAAGGGRALGLGLARVRRPHSGGHAPSKGAASPASSTDGANAGHAVSPSPAPPAAPLATPPQPSRRASSASGALGLGLAADADADGARAGREPASPSDAGSPVTPRGAEPADGGGRAVGVGASPLTPAQAMRARKLAVADEAASQLAAAAAKQKASHDAAARRGRLQFETSGQRLVSLSGAAAARAPAPVVGADADAGGGQEGLAAEGGAASGGSAGGGSAGGGSAAERGACAQLSRMAVDARQSQPLRASTPAELPSQRHSRQPSCGQAPIAELPAQQPAAAAQRPLFARQPLRLPAGGAGGGAAPRECGCTPLAEGQGEGCAGEREVDASECEGADGAAGAARFAGSRARRAEGGASLALGAPVASPALGALKHAGADEDSRRLSRLACAQLHTSAPARSRGASAAAADGGAASPATLRASEGEQPPPGAPHADALPPPHNSFEPSHSAAERAAALHARCAALLGDDFRAVYDCLKSHHQRQDGSDVRPALAALVGRDRLDNCFSVDQLIFQELLNGQ